jgi:hypothetical protein
MFSASRRVERRVDSVRMWERESRTSERSDLCIREPCCMPVNGHSLSLYSRSYSSPKVMRSLREAALVTTSTGSYRIVVGWD